MQATSRSPERQFLHQVLAGNEPAMRCCEILFSVSQTLDDIVDGDREVTAAAVIKSYWEAMIELPGNPFYRQHEPYLRPLLAQALQDWTDSVALERSQDRHALTLAFVLRDQLSGFVVQCAGLVAGYDWMRQIGPTIRQYFHDERLDDYLASLQPEDGEVEPVPEGESAS
ncbi:hypothetical protein [Salinicola peritrichatus]|uniref:hypothetical protein n=1 Tax=Salinicola peritrichatus TaxID=1267424 RepID=UPI0013A6014D|nr:hypothetical protein [Salinicola peritrichatus]